MNVTLSNKTAITYEMYVDF